MASFSTMNQRVLSDLSWRSFFKHHENTVEASHMGEILLASKPGIEPRFGV